ncbi:MAG: hypothetical protein JSR17_03800 [Proteobacteria bacterium]|nr:hypothetical protein [Pseudomonadota bacterium]
MIELKQNVNFFQVEEEDLPWLSATRLCQLWLGLFVVLAFFAIHTKWSQYYAVKSMEEIKTKRDQVNEELQAISQEIKAKNNPQKIQEEINLLKDNISHVQSAIAQLQEQENYKTYNLSLYLQGFANTHVKGMYVSHFYLQNEGKKMSFQGDALSAQLVPQMVQSWEKTQVMKGRKFQQLSIERVNNKTDIVKFKLQAE